MNTNQYPFEMLRDLITLLDKLEPGEEMTISVKRHPSDKNSSLIDWRTSRGMAHGTSELSAAMGKAYCAERENLALAPLKWVK